MRILFIITAAILVTPLFGQSLERQVIGTSGTAVENGSSGTGFTIGELVTLNAVNASGGISQGFQQAEEEDFIDVIDLQLQELMLTVFPNPATDRLETRSDLAEHGITELNYEVLDAHGRLVLSGSVPSNDGIIDISSLAVSTYVLVLSANENEFRKIVRFTRVQ